MQYHLIAALVLLGATLAASLPASPAPKTDDSSFKLPESFDIKEDNSSSTLLPATTAPSNNVSKPSESVDIIQSTKFNHTWPAMEDPNLFEGDLKISKEMIETYYGKKSEKNSTEVSLAFKKDGAA